MSLDSTKCQQKETNIIHNIKGIVTKLKNNGYSFILYPRILMIVAEITSSLPIEHYLECVHCLMKTNIKDSTENIHFTKQGSDILKNEAIKTFNKLFDELDELAQASTTGKLKSDISTIFEGEWGAKLWDHVSSNNSKINQGNFFTAS